MDVSVITTLYNERESVEELLDSLLSQTVPPAEIVVADGGSTDGTRDVLREWQAQGKVKLVERPGGRSTGRNAAISAASHELIACIDGGCVAEPDWLEHLTAPFARGADWVAGFYRPEGPTQFSICLGLVMVYVPEEVRADSFLPSARSMAFRRNLWKEVGGFPEEARYAEDTLFDVRALEAGYQPVLALEAVVRWRPPGDFGELARTLFRWGHWDGRTGLRGYAYKRLLLLYGGTVAGVLLALLLEARALPLVLSPLAISVTRRTRFKYRWAPGPLKYLHIPTAHLVGSLAQLTGFLLGRLSR
jgi:glycosyltransferase involved in cell wall biosynthesis